MCGQRLAYAGNGVNARANREILKQQSYVNPVLSRKWKSNDHPETAVEFGKRSRAEAKFLSG